MGQQIPEGWYADPQARAPGEERWWNGHHWTAHTRTVQAVSAHGPSGPVLRPAASLPDGTPVAEVGERVVAYLVDVALVFVVGTVVGRLLESAAGFAGYVGVPLGAAWWVLQVTLVPTSLGLAWLGYQLAFRRSGATLGKRLLHLRARPLDADGPLTTGQAVRRAVIGSGGILCTMFPGAPLPGFLLLAYEAWTMSKDPLGRPWHDQVAGTVVIRTPRS